MPHRAREGGLFITLEGPEGSGKSTQAAAMARSLEERGYRVHSFAEPGGTRISEAIRGILLHPDHTEMTARCEVLLFLASRAQLVRQSIQPALDAGDVVVCDRYTDSTLAYQSVSTGMSLTELRAMNDFATGGLIPHLTILLDLNVEAGLQRQGRWNRMEQRGLEYHERVRAVYLQLAEICPRRIHTLSASGSTAAVQAEIWNTLEAFLQ